MAKGNAEGPVMLSDDILDRLRDLYKQATVERSHYYTGRCISGAVNEIAHPCAKLVALAGATVYSAFTPRRRGGKTDKARRARS
jgi:hypothetical protein